VPKDGQKKKKNARGQGREQEGRKGVGGDLISKLAPDSAHLETPTASIGIRGTKFVARVEGE
jgi:hypothetical protein